MPAFARVLAQGLPLTHFIRIVRGIVLKASDFPDLARELVWMAAILAVLVTLSSLRFRKKLI
jgi:ABC-2 type transport system permease protein